MRSRALNQIPDEACAIAEEVLRVIKEQWEQRFYDAGVPPHEINSLRGTAVLSPVAVTMAPGHS